MVYDRAVQQVSHKVALCGGSTEKIPDVMLMRVCDAAIQAVAPKNAWLRYVIGSFPICSDWDCLS
jgi:hypothetical protein